LGSKQAITGDANRKSANSETANLPINLTFRLVYLSVASTAMAASFLRLALRGSLSADLTRLHPNVTYFAFIVTTLIENQTFSQGLRAWATTRPRPSTSSGRASGADAWIIHVFCSFMNNSGWAQRKIKNLTADDADLTDQS
jgi:hypothetical protein